MSYMIVTNVGFLVASTKEQVRSSIIKTVGLHPDSRIDLSLWYDWAFNEVLYRKYKFDNRFHYRTSAADSKVLDSLEPKFSRIFYQSLGKENLRILDNIDLKDQVKAILSNETLVILSCPSFY
jgi:hypothetical protein